MIRVERRFAEPRGVGASELGAVTGCDPWTTPLQLYRRKLGLDPARPDNEAMAVGRGLEGFVVALARERIPLRIRRNRLTFVPFRSSPLFATPDAFVGPDRLLEVKVVGIRSADVWDDELPCRTKLQVQGQLYVTGRQAAYVAQLVGTELRLALVEADPTVQVELVEAADRFAALLVDRTPPDPLSWDERWAELLSRIAPLPERDVLAGGTVQAAGDRIVEIRAQVAQLDDEVRDLRAELLGALADGQGTRLVGTGWTAALQTRSDVSWREVARELDPPPDLVDRYRSSSSSLVLRGSRHD